MIDTFKGLSGMESNTPSFYAMGKKVTGPPLPAKAYYVRTKYLLRDFNGHAVGSLPAGTKVTASDFMTELPGKGSIKYRILYTQYGQGPKLPKKGAEVIAGKTGTRPLVAASGLQTSPPPGFWGTPGKKPTKSGPPAGTTPEDNAGADPSLLVLAAAVAAAYYFLG